MLKVQKYNLKVQYKSERELYIADMLAEHVLVKMKLQYVMRNIVCTP